MFYFSDTRCVFKAGKMQLQTEFPFYEPGNTINGKIFIEVPAPVQASHIELEFKGKEEVKWIRYWHETEGERQVERHEKIHRERKFLEYKQRVFAIPGGFINAGSSEVSFQFTLPTGIPSSFYYKDKKCREKPKAKVKYTVKATLCSTLTSEEMKYKQVLIIREPPVTFKTGDKQMEVSQIKTCCCMDKGQSTMYSEFEKNVFLPNEIVKGYVHVDNDRCQIACTNVHFAAEMRMTLRNGIHHYPVNRDLVQQNVVGPAAGEAGWKREMQIDLSKIHYEVTTSVKSKKGGKKQLSPEDQFMMASIQPACHAKWITNDYHLVV
jgi:hypothetical protein